jgi:rhodanese-related sulfurtransferase
MIDVPHASIVQAIAAAAPVVAERHFLHRLAFETDCADVHADLEARVPDLVVLDVRSADAYVAGHLPGSRSMPHREISAQSTAAFCPDALHVVYCWGPHCNGATRAAAKLAALGFRVKEMLGGIAGWEAEGFRLATGPEPGLDVRS